MCVWTSLPARSIVHLKLVTLAEEMLFAFQKETCQYFSIVSEYDWLWCIINIAGCHWTAGHKHVYASNACLPASPTGKLHTYVAQAFSYMM